MKTLTPQIIKEIIQEEIEKRLESDEWGSKLKSLKKELDAYAKDSKEPKRSIISPGLEIRDKEGNLFIVQKVAEDYMWIETPAGRQIKISTKRLKDFKVD